LKKARNSSYNGLIEDEVNWYKFVARKGFNNVPKIVSYSPLVMERIRGDHPFNLMNGQKASLKDKKEIISKIIDSLMELHSIANTRRIQAVAKEVYVEKTLKRISVISGIVPHSDSDFYYVNGKKAPNLLIHQNLPYLESLYSLISKESPDSPFTLIHGDPTFSNILIKSTDAMPIFIDPRGYFGSLKLFGDPLYDFSKLYYSAIGNYDFFNQGKFRLKMNNGSIEIKIKSEGFEGTQSLFSEYFDKQILAIRGLHALIWISLSGYVTDDYDAMLGSYFHGIQLMAEVLNDYA
jgi:thiamine kinase-like enzyme